MAILELEDQKMEVEDGFMLRDAAEEMGLAIGCGQGACGTCEVVIEEGIENLNALTESEIDMEMKESHRLMCQCSIKSGTVLARFKK